MRSLVAIEMAASPELVFAVVSDPRRWPALLPHYRAVRPLRGSRSAPMLARYEAVRSLVRSLGLGIPVAWTAASWRDPRALELHFRHVGGPTAGMRVRWRIIATTAGCRVSIEHELRPTSPWLRALGRLDGDLYPRVVDRLFVRPIASRTLRAFRAICEALAATPPASILTNDGERPTQGARSLTRTGGAP